MQKSIFNHFLEAILDQMPAGVSIAEAPSGKLLMHNKEAVRLIRHPLLASETYEGYAQYGALHEDMTPYDPGEYPIARSLQGEVVEQEEMIYRRGDDTITTFLVNAAPIYNDEGVIIFSVSTFYDISDIKKVHKELKKAKEDTEKAANAKEEFLSNMSHEIRTPLHSVIGLAKLLIKKDPRPDQLDNLKALNFSAQNLLHLINDILDFSKIEAGKVELEKNIVVLPELMENIRQAYSTFARSNGNTIKLEIDEDAPEFIQTDRLKLSQILNNLISNAVKFTLDGTIHLNVSQLEKKNKQHHLLFSVKDTGIGISKEKLKYIFDKFSRAHDSSGKQFEGTGLGLAISQMLAKLLNTNIEVESTVDRGTCFSFRLWVESIDSNEIPDKKESTEDIYNFENIKVLLAEDVDLNRMLIVQFLEEWWKIVPDVAENGKEAVEKVRENMYDLILMDLRMPEMDGYDAASIIKKLPGREQIPIIAFTANTRSDFRKNIYSDIFSGLITKPVEPEELQKAMINQLIKSGKFGGKISIQKIKDFIGEDPVKIRRMLEKAAESLKTYKGEFKHAMENQSLTELSDIKHKAKVLMNVLGLDDLKDLFQHSKQILQKEEKADGQIIKKSDKLFDTYITQIEKQINTPS